MQKIQDYQPGDEVMLKDGRAGLLYALTQNSRNPLARDRRRPASWYFIPDRIGVHGVAVISQPCTVSKSDIKRRTGHRSGNWPEIGYVMEFNEKQRVYVDVMAGRL